MPVGADYITLLVKNLVMRNAVKLEQFTEQHILVFGQTAGIVILQMLLHVFVIHHFRRLFVTCDKDKSQLRIFTQFLTDGFRCLNIGAARSATCRPEIKKHIPALKLIGYLLQNLCSLCLRQFVCKIPCVKIMLVHSVCLYLKEGICKL